MAKSRTSFNKAGDNDSGGGDPPPQGMSASPDPLTRRKQTAMGMMTQFLSDAVHSMLDVSNPDFRLTHDPDFDNYTILLRQKGEPDWAVKPWTGRVLALLDQACARANSIDDLADDPECGIMGLPGQDTFLDPREGKVTVNDPHAFLLVLQQVTTLLNKDWQEDLAMIYGPIPGLLNDRETRRLLRTRLETVPDFLTNMRACRPYIDEEDLLGELYTVNLPENNDSGPRPRFSLRDIEAVLPDPDEVRQGRSARRSFSGFNFYYH